MPKCLAATAFKGGIALNLLAELLAAALIRRPITALIGGLTLIPGDTFARFACNVCKVGGGVSVILPEDSESEWLNLRDRLICEKGLDNILDEFQELLIGELCLLQFTFLVFWSTMQNKFK